MSSQFSRLTCIDSTIFKTFKGVITSSLETQVRTLQCKSSMCIISVIVLCPILIPLQTSTIRDTCSSFHIYSAKNLLHCSLNPKILLVLILTKVKRKTKDTYFFPLLVTGISGHSSIIPGTCLALNSLLITFLTSSINFCSSFLPSAIFKNSTTVSSASCSLLLPMHSASLKYSGNSFNSTLYISALPNLTPAGFSIPSLLPSITKPPVLGLNRTKSP